MSNQRNSRSNPRLAGSTSPYLRQHADNPVDWYEWGPEALQRARDENKPILLSVGYSACHWCHVMAHESFEDEVTAATMNACFVNIKVDREERPDIDALYQKTVQLMGQGGGWPLTVFMLPDQRPFYAGTYFPKSPMYGRPSFGQVLRAVHQLFEQQPDKVAEHAREFHEGLRALAAGLDDARRKDHVPPAWDGAALVMAAQKLLTRVDAEWGGFGRAPKFPNPTALECLLQRARDQDDDASLARAALRKTLECMVHGGIYDQLRGGFARYSIDRMWLVPHFEKMLYDNAQLLALYARAGSLWEDSEFHRVVEDTTEYLLADMHSPHGFFAATDADSEGVEGKYFCWTPGQVAEVLGEARLTALFCAVYGVTQAGNFEHGMSILHRTAPLSAIAQELEIDAATAQQQLDHAKARLLAHRYTRIAPARDEKVLTCWNALTISALVHASEAALCRGADEHHRRWRELASNTCRTLLELHVDQASGRVWRAAFEGRAHTRAVVDDVAALGRACLDLYELTLSSRWLEASTRLAAYACRMHARDGGGFWLTAADGEALLEREESRADGALPSGVGMMLELLLRLDAQGVSTDDMRACAAQTLERFAGAADEPFAYASIVLAGRCHPNLLVHVTLLGPDVESPALLDLWHLVVAARRRSSARITLGFAHDAKVGAIVCRQQVCSLPLRTREELDVALTP